MGPAACEHKLCSWAPSLSSWSGKGPHNPAQTPAASANATGSKCFEEKAVAFGVSSFTSQDTVPSSTGSLTSDFAHEWRGQISLLSHQVSSACLHHSLTACALGISRIIPKEIILIHLQNVIQERKGPFDPWCNYLCLSVVSHRRPRDGDVIVCSNFKTQLSV